MNVKISRTNDPFKRYWWVILLIFIVVGAALCLPDLSAVSGSSYAGGGDGVKGGEQSLDSANNPSGAPGSAIDLSMDGSGGAHKGDGPITSSLYQAPAEETASSTAAARSGSNLADALRSVAKNSAQRSASADPSGWGGEKAQKGFTAPKVAAAGFSNLAAGGGGGGGGGGGEGGMAAFGSGQAKTGVSLAKGLSGSASMDTMANASASMRSLNTASNNAIAAAGLRSGDAASAMGGKSFDGGSFMMGNGGGRGGGGGGGGGAAIGGKGAGAYNSLDMAPANLKSDGSNHLASKISVPAAPVVPPPAPSMMQMIMQMVMMGLIGGLMSGIMGAV